MNILPFSVSIRISPGSLPNQLSVQGAKLEPDAEQVVELVLDWGTHRLVGQVVNGQGASVPASRVWVSMNYRSGGLESRSTRMTTADVNGLFAFTNLGPGLHRIWVDAPGFEEASLAQMIQAQEERVRVMLD